MDIHETKAELDELFSKFESFYILVTAVDGKRDVHENTTKYERMRIAVELMKLFPG